MTRVAALRSLYEIAGKTLPDEALALVRADGSRYVQLVALELLSQREDDREKVALLYKDLASRTRASEDVAVREALARTEAWLVKTLGSAPTRDQESLWQRRYLEAPLVTERTALLDMLEHASIERAQQFALERTTEAGWATSDRKAMTAVLARTVTPVSLPFLEQAIGGSSYIFVHQTLNALIGAGVDEPALVPALLKGARDHRYYDVRARMAVLLGKQGASKTVVCPALAELAVRSENEPLSGYLDVVHGAASSAAQELACHAE